MNLMDMGKRAKEASKALRQMKAGEKNTLLTYLGEALLKRQEEILLANEEDLARGRALGLSAALMDRLLLSKERIEAMVAGVFAMATMEDPVGRMTEMKTLQNGLQVGKKTVPLGVVGIIYESRPNVTVDTAALCLKSSNALILRGGKEAISANKVLVRILQEALKEKGYTPYMVQLISRVVQEATVPVIETGMGNCHVYVDEFADEAMALSIIENAKTQRVGVCNAMESLVVHEALLQSFLPKLEALMVKHQVKIYADNKAREVLSHSLVATEEDFGTEYLDLAFSLKTVGSMEEAMAHIDTYGTGHSEAIITEHYGHAMTFLEEVDAAAVYVNASTRFTDGGALEMGAEMGISTQKLHARGPVGLKELTTTKYVIFGQGQVRP